MRKSLALLLILLFLTSLVMLQPALSAHTALSWNVQTVDENAWVGGYCPIAVDSNNTAHIAYMGFPNGTNLLIYASYNGSRWTDQIVDDSGYVHVVFSLVLDSNGNPHILYNPNPVGSQINPLKYASWTGRNWDIQNTGINYASYATLALDSYGNPHIAYTTGIELQGLTWIGNALNYASWTGTNWNIQTVTENMTDGFSTVSLAVDLNKPYILYSSSSNSSEIKLATFKDSSWNIQSVVVPTSTANCGNVVVDSNGSSHFICTQQYQNSTTLSTILYASWNGNSWNTQTVASKVNLDSIGSLVLDSHNNPHFTYSTSSGETMYVDYSGSAWNIQTTASNIGTGNLALDADDNPHLSYRTASPARYYANLMYATATETIPAPTLISVNDQILIAVVIAAVIALGIVLLIYRRHRKTTNSRNKNGG